MSDQSLHDRLKTEFGAAVETRPANAGDALDGVQPTFVAVPRDEEAALALVAFSGRERLALIPRGGGTKWHIGAVPSRFDVLLSTEKLNAVFEHDEGNATVTAAAGITIEALNEAVGQRGQFVPIDAAPGATLGGVIATNSFGPSRLKYGMPRDLVVGLNAALSDGRLVKAGSKVVKNVSGYDLNKLFIGSYGSLGLVTQVILRLRPHDASTETWSAGFDSWEAAQQQAFAIIDGAFEPTLLRVVGDGENVRVFAQFDGVPAATQVQLSRLPVSQGLEPVTANGEAVVSLRATVLLREAPKWAALARSNGATHVAWEVGSGIVEADFAAVPNVAALRAAAVAAGGSVLVTRAPVENKTAEFVWGAPGSSFGLISSLKQKYDAAGVFAPGRSLGGL